MAGITIQTAPLKEKKWEMLEEGKINSDEKIINVSISDGMLTALSILVPCGSTPKLNVKILSILFLSSMFNSNNKQKLTCSHKGGNLTHNMHYSPMKD